MLPESLDGIDFAHAYHSASEAARVGGDFYDLFALERSRVGITIGDISGHGIDAAALTSLVKNGIRVEATQEDRPPDEVVTRVSRLLLDGSAPEIFATVFYGVLDLADGLLLYCNAGHTMGCVLRSGGEGVTHLPANSPLAGALPGPAVLRVDRAHRAERPAVPLHRRADRGASRPRAVRRGARCSELLAGLDGADPAGCRSRRHGRCDVLHRGRAA